MAEVWAARGLLGRRCVASDARWRTQSECTLTTYQLPNARERATRRCGWMVRMDASVKIDTKC